MNHKGTITLETERLILRRLKVSDAEAMFRNWAGNPEAAKYMTWQPHSDVADSQEYTQHCVESYRSLSYYHWAIVPRNFGELIGTIGVEKQSEDIQTVHIGYCIGELWWNNSYTSEALAAIIKFLFEEVGANRIEACHDARNGASGAVMRKCGMQYEGKMCQCRILKGELTDLVNYAILAEDYSGTTSK